MTLIRSGRRFPGFSVAAAALLVGGAVRSLLGACGPFTDVAADSFCPFVLEIFYLGITTGTTPTTYDPNANVTRLQMAAFLSRTVDRTLQRGSRRAALNQFWKARANIGTTTAGRVPILAVSLASDGSDLWISSTDDTVRRVRGSDGRPLETWTGAGFGNSVLVAAGQVYVDGSFGRLYAIDPGQPPGSVTTVATNLGSPPDGLAFDGARIWSANHAEGVSIVTPGTTIPWTVTTVTSASFSNLLGMLYDGSNIWVTDQTAGKLFKLGSNGALLQTVTVGATPVYPAFDGSNIWVPNNGDHSISVVRASNGSVLATLTGNGLNEPYQTAFDGERILVTNASGDSVSLWKAADLTTIGTFSTGPGSAPVNVCSDGIHFWIRITANVVKF